MNLFVDTSVWSLAFRRDKPIEAEEVSRLIAAIETGETIVATGLVLQELLQGFAGPKQRGQLLERFSAVPLLAPDREDHVAAADLKCRCRRAGAQIGTIDALFAQLCVRHDLTMLTCDKDFSRIARHCELALWAG